MRKILKYFAVVIALTMLLSIKVSAADYKCEYSDGKLTAKFTIDTKNKKASRVTLKGVLKTSDDGLFENDGKRNVDETESVINWEKDYEGIRAIGVHYYKNNNDCPPYGFLVDRQHGLEFAVFSESHKSEFEKLGKSKQGYAIMKLTSSSKKETDDGSDTKYEAGSCLEYTTKNSCE